MAACTDIRVATTWPAHPKTRKLRRRLGLGGPLGFIHLLAYAGANRPDGDLSGMSDEDIELAADWEGGPGEFVAAAVAVGFLDGEPGRYRLHDWAVHQPWAAGAVDRSERARFAVLCRDFGRPRAIQMMPVYAAKLSGGAGAGSGSDPVDDPVDQVRSSPSPFPSSPSLSKAKATVHSAAPIAPSDGELPDGLGLTGEPPMPEAPAPADDPPADPPPAPPKRITGQKKPQTAVRFPEFWAAYPVKKGRADALKKWKAKNLDPMADQLIAHVRKMEAEDDTWKRGFIPHGDTYVNQERWTDEPQKEKGAVTAPGPDPAKVGPKAALAPSETPLEREVNYIRQQHHLGVYGEGEAADAEKRRLIAEATEKHRRNAHGTAAPTEVLR